MTNIMGGSDIDPPTDPIRLEATMSPPNLWGGYPEAPSQIIDRLAVVENYQKDAERTSATKDYEGQWQAHQRITPKTMRLLHGAMGLCTEAGELQDQLKKHIFYGKPLDIVNIAEECGDLFWYLAETLTAIDQKFVDVMQRNIDKLRARYPEKFTEEKALNRDLDAERSILEQ